MSKYPCLHVNAAVSHNILQLFLCMSNSAKRNENHKAPVWNLNESLPEMFFFSIYPILNWVNKRCWGFVLWVVVSFPWVQIPTGKIEERRNLIFLEFLCYFYFVLGFFVVCFFLWGEQAGGICIKTCPTAQELLEPQSIGGWESILGKYHDTLTHSYILFVFHLPRSTHSTRCGMVWVLQTTQFSPSM